MELPSLVSRIAYGFDPSVPTPTYQDVSEFAQALRVQRGRENERQQPGASTADITYRNADGQFTPPALTLMTKVQHAAVWDAVEYPLHTGHIERTPLQWQTEDESNVSPTAVDLTAALAAALVWGDLPEETTGERISRLLDWAGQPSGAGPPGAGYWLLGTSLLDSSAVLSPEDPTRVIATGAVTVSAKTIAADSPQSALAVIQETATAEPGVFFVDAQGRAIFQDRNARFGQTAVCTFTDDLDTLTATRIKYQDLAPSYQVDQVVNEVSIVSTIADVVVTVVEDDAESRQQYLRRSVRYDLPLVSESEMAVRAAFELLLYAQPSVRYDRLSVLPASQPDSWPTILALELGDMVDVERQGTSRPVFVEAIEHVAQPGGWKVALTLSPADAFAEVWVLDTSELEISSKLAA